MRSTARSRWIWRSSDSPAVRPPAYPTSLRTAARRARRRRAVFASAHQRADGGQPGAMIAPSTGRQRNSAIVRSPAVRTRRMLPSRSRSLSLSRIAPPRLHGFPHGLSDITFLPRYVTRTAPKTIYQVRRTSETPCRGSVTCNAAWPAATRRRRGASSATSRPVRSSSPYCAGAGGSGEPMRFQASYELP